MYKDVLRSIEGIEIFPLVSLTIFFLFFSFVIWGTMRAKKTVIDQIALMPLDGATADELKTTKPTNHE